MKKIILTVLFLFTLGTVFSQDVKDNEFDRLSLKASFSLIQHLEPQIYGQNKSTQDFLTYGGVLSGLETMNGVNFKAYYFFKNNIGIYFDAGFGLSSNSIFYQNAGQPLIQISTEAEFNNQSLGVAARFSSDNVPVNLIVGTSIGRYGYSMSYTQTSFGIGPLYKGTHDILKFGFEGLIEYKIFKGFNLFSEINYSTDLGVDSDGFDMDTDDGDYYKIQYNSPSMAAIRISIGIGYNF